MLCDVCGAPAQAFLGFYFPVERGSRVKQFCGKVVCRDCFDNSSISQGRLVSFGEERAEELIQSVKIEKSIKLKY